MHKTKNIRVLILQERIAPYRIDVFHQLAQSPDLDVTVAHSGALSTDATRAYREIRLTQHRVGPIRYQAGLRPLARDFDVVIAMFDVRWLSTMRLLFSKNRPGLVLWGHGFGRNPLVNRFRLLCVKSADALLLYDEAQRAEFEARGCSRDRIFVAPNTIHVLEPRISWENGRRHFLFVGRLQARKGIENVLIAFEKARAQLPGSCRILIAGDGSERDRLKATVKRLGLEESVDFLGEVRNPEALAACFENALAYVSPGHVGLGVLHSFAHGVPVITFPSKGHAPEVNNIRSGENGYICEPHELAPLMVRLANDPSESVRLGKEAYRHYYSSRTVNHMAQGFQSSIQYALQMGMKESPNRSGSILSAGPTVTKDTI